MTKVTIYNDKSGNHIGFEVRGHAEYGYAGQDIVCAAISMLVTNTINSIEKFTDLAIKYDESEKDGRIRFRIMGGPSHDSQLLLDAMILGLSDLKKNYPKNVTLKTKEV